MYSSHFKTATINCQIEKGSCIISPETTFPTKDINLSAVIMPYKLSKIDSRRSRGIVVNHQSKSKIELHSPCTSNLNSIFYVYLIVPEFFLWLTNHIF